MRFSPNGFYIDSYGKCANCGVLLYDEDHALRHDDRSFCSEWCLTWSKRPADDASPLPLEGAKHTYAGATDVVDLKILDGNLASICRDMGTTVMRTAYSPIFSESLDFTCGLFDRRGEMIAVGDFCPSMIGGMPLIVRTIVEEIPLDEMHEGDVIVHNDPYRGGMHTPEHTFLKPIFLDGEIVGFAGAIGHIGEIGGMVPGSFYAEATEIFAEGLRIPPVKIKARGKDQPDVWRLMLANVRTPRANYGDYRALIAGADLGERRVLELIERYGLARFERACADLLDYSEARMRAEIAEVPSGSYGFTDVMEDDGITVDTLTINVKVMIQGDEAIVDYAGTSPQTRGPMNTPLSIPQAASYNAFLQICDFTIPKNAGCFRPIKVLVQPGSLLNVEFPAPSVGGNTECHPRIVYTVLGALAKAVPDRVPAADGGTWSNFLFGGTHPETGEYYTSYDLHTVGWGGRPGADGNDAVGSMNGNCRTVPVEVYETRYPWLVEDWSLVPGSGGAGEFRGGLGMQKTIRCLAPEIIASHVGDRHQVPPWGLHGGGPAGLASTVFKVAGSDVWADARTVYGKVSPSKFAHVTIRDGDRVHVAMSGGGGWGDPARRDPEAVAHDVAEGYISTASAERDYGSGETTP
ncbi:hydantoinase B/oxoprolinase family protein [Bauldia litoralis]|uniref:N-methylhydantoinase B n=1 Tax=Bauldia litoralis TaxID=665467 RepID=A0A1G6BIQ8_9HYPH|nr:hydantoinase B/oxoprolinase family protein [Bauldia litoralis]SDB20505.1 N-methylhydantoinase B [Bauldia litoralis]